MTPGEELEATDAREAEEETVLSARDSEREGLRISSSSSMIVKRSSSSHSGCCPPLHEVSAPYDPTDEVGVAHRLIVFVRFFSSKNWTVQNGSCLPKRDLLGRLR